MKITHQKQHGDKKNSMGVIAAGVAGGIALAGVAAVAATIALKDDKTRKKVKHVLNDMKDQALDYVDKLNTESDTKEAVETVKKITTDTKKVVGEK